MNFYDYLVKYASRLESHALDHANIVVVSVLLATAIGITIGILTYRVPWAYKFAIAASSAFLTIPSLALLGLMIPIFGLGTLPALVALVLYALLPIIRNTVTGLQGVNPTLLEAASGMGMRERSVLLRVQLPLAWPVILTGIRVATQLTIGVAGSNDKVSLPATQLTRTEKHILGSFYGGANPHRDFVMILDMYKRGRVKLDELVGMHFPLPEINQAVAAMRTGAFARVVVDF